MEPYYLVSALWALEVRSLPLAEVGQRVWYQPEELWALWELLVLLELWA